MNILITGGAGYIGSILTPMLAQNGFDVTVVDDFRYRSNSLLADCHLKNIDVIKADVRDLNAYKKKLKEADIVLPLAAIVGAPACKQKPAAAEEINYKSILKLFSSLSKDQMVIMPTTNSAYGTGDENNFCDETSPLRPISQYAIEKVKVEEELMSLNFSVSLRLATVFGASPRMRIDLLVNDFVYRAQRDGFVVLFEPHFKRNYIHIRDVANAFLHTIKNNEAMKGEVYNVGLSNANISKLELCEEIKKQIPKFIFPIESIYKDPDQRNYLVSNKKIESTGFCPDFTLQDGIAELLKAYKIINQDQFTNL